MIHMNNRKQLIKKNTLLTVKKLKKYTKTKINKLTSRKENFFNYIMIKSLIFKKCEGKNLSINSGIIKKSDR